ncbi:hypothetical protein DAEQUDRAFT_441797 [Daedalea quercina L-15889]|uniref:Uncharacterized protein n=1 Tax=Daedalea quercina L-15889 TaxID=1314783 RepID=A0A165N917_9APHY|nr:hypothetical protein DAEQUDRAFT_441797 [Daedalea quercina L-15889]
MRSYTAALIVAAATASVAPILAVPIAFTSDLQARGEIDSLEARGYDSPFTPREELFARALDDELVARSKIGRKIGGFFKKIGKGIAHAVSFFTREDVDVLARELGIDEEVFARGIQEGLEAREFDDGELLARGFDSYALDRRDLDELFARMLMEEHTSQTGSNPDTATHPQHSAQHYRQHAALQNGEISHHGHQGLGQEAGEGHHRVQGHSQHLPSTVHSREDVLEMLLARAFGDDFDELD